MIKYIEQTLNVWAEVRSVSNFFWNHTDSQGSRKVETVRTCSQPICDFGSHFSLASWNSFRNKCLPAKMSLKKMEVASQIGLKAQKRCIKTLVIGIISFKTRNIHIYIFFNNLWDRTWQPLLVSSQPILDFLDRWHLTFDMWNMTPIKQYMIPD